MHTPRILKWGLGTPWGPSVFRKYVGPVGLVKFKIAFQEQLSLLR